MRSEEATMGRLIILAIGAFALAIGAPAMAQGKNDLIGTWKLISVISTTDKGDVNKAVYGENPKGFITYTADGRMSVVISEGGRKPLSVNDRVTAPMEEK